MFNLVYGIREGKLISIDEISYEERGLKCNCFCPSCGGRLQAKIGSGIRARHFSHINKDCDIKTALQTALHLMAKEIIAEKKQMILPEYVVKITDTDYYRSHYSNGSNSKYRDIKFVYEKAKRVNFDNVYLEKKVSEIVPDIIALSQAGCYLIEIAVTHFIDREKQTKINQLNFPVIEIDLSDMNSHVFCREQLENILVNDIKRKKWIHYPMNDEERLSLYKWGESNAQNFCERKESEESLEYWSHIKNSRDWFAMAEKCEKVSDEFKDKVLNEILKREEKGREQIDYQNKMDEIYQPEIYKKKIERLRNQKKFKNYYSTLSMSKSKTTPFYIDIPITGEFIFNCDRRIWQSAIFDKFILNGIQPYDDSGRYPLDYDLVEDIKEWIKKDQKVFTVNWKYAKKHWYCGSTRALFNYVIEKYIEYLLLLGFVKQSKRTYGIFKKYWYRLISPNTLRAPNRKNAEKLYRAIRSVEYNSPDADIYIRRFLESNK